ncbi:hypothetical protein NDU88_001007 [Pleurodeles waltl]|uniref:Uncharacterized protein n=1 Tax=Pleurodeles waltl TaxID=8319 RepID=A0AAV7VV71_PLEWA|nr:hypothetical protein NDU88_001007 [Pleurodeles waltl]
MNSTCFYRIKDTAVPTVILTSAQQSLLQSCCPRPSWSAGGGEAARRSTFGFERAGMSTKEAQKHKDQVPQTVLFIDEGGQTGVAAEREGILDPATQKFEQAYASRSRKTRQV